MRWLEVRRHSYAKKGPSRGRGSHLSAEGVALARAVGADMGPYAIVVTSTQARTMETALAMGFAVDDAVDMPSGYVAGEVGHHDQWQWSEPYATYADKLAQQRGLSVVASAHRTLWTRVVESVPDGASALVIASGGAIEPALVACMPLGDHHGWGGPFRHCDGVVLAFDGAFASVEFRRVAVENPDEDPMLTEADD